MKISGNIVGEIQQLGRKRSQKINYDVILHYISLPIYPLPFPKILLRSKTIKNAKKCLFRAVYLIFYKLIFFESLIIFLEPAIKLITGIFDLQK